MPSSFMLCFISRKEYLSLATCTGKGPFLHQALPIPGFVHICDSTRNLKMAGPPEWVIQWYKANEGSAGEASQITNVYRIDFRGKGRMRKSLANLVQKKQTGRTVSMNIALGRWLQKVSNVLSNHSYAERCPRHPSEWWQFTAVYHRIVDLLRVREMGNIHLPFVYLHTVAQWLCLQIIPVPNKMILLDITTIFPSYSSSKLALWVYGCLVPSQFWYMGSFLIKHPSLKELKTVPKSFVDQSLKIWNVLWGVLGVDHKAHFRNI